MKNLFAIIIILTSFASTTHASINNNTTISKAQIPKGMGIDFLPEFTEYESMTGVSGSSVVWGDYDNDTFVDFLLTGDSGGTGVAKIYRNNGDGSFTEQTDIELTGVKYSSVAWGDYDNDNYIDILLTGNTDGTNSVSKLYKNNGDGSFTEQAIGLTAVYNGSVAWGDYNNDNYLDILLTGLNGTTTIVSKLYKNNGDGSFSEQSVGLTGVMNSSVDWGDYNNDTFLDIILTGYSSTGNTSKIYKNNGNGTFTEQILISLTGVSEGSVAWGDYNNDNYLDILLTGITGFTNDTRVAKIYKNSGLGTFSEQGSISLTAVTGSSVMWGDYNNDNYLDILLTGNSGTGTPISRIYKNNGSGNFAVQASISLTGISVGSAAWGDYDNDNYLDILLTGTNSSSLSISELYKNNADNSFSKLEETVNLATVASSFISWGDYDKNNYQDQLISGASTIPIPPDIGTVFSGIYYNSESENSLSDINISGAGACTNTWFDYDNDGYLDIIISGKNSSIASITKIYSNGTNGVFINSNINIEGTINGSIDYADYNNDGFTDILLSGRNEDSDYFVKVYKNTTNGDFQETFISLPSCTRSILGRF